MKQEKPKYSRWQNAGFMLRTAWHGHKSVPILCVVLALLIAAQLVTQLLLAPTLLEALENGVSLGRLLALIGGFTAALMLLAGLREYVNRNTMPARIEVRLGLLNRIGEKQAMTSYPNLMNKRFAECRSRAIRGCSANSESAEAIWNTLTDLLINTLCFAAYLFFLSRLSLLPVVFVLVTSAAAFLVNDRLNGWSYRHRDESREIIRKQDYCIETALGKPFGKDLRIFGLKPWLCAVWDAALRLERDFLARRERVYLWTDVVNLLAVLLRNGVAYAYLIAQAIGGTLTAAEFVLYFAAISGFSEWIGAILQGISTLGTQSRELSLLREFLEWPEPFRFADGKPLHCEAGKAHELRLENVSYRYPEAGADTIHAMNLTVRPGEKLAVVGLNGAGKTTLMKLLCGFLDPTEGRVLLDGEDIRQYDRRDYYALFSAVFQEFSVLDVTVAQNVAQNVDDDRIDLPRVWRCLEQAGLSEKIRSLPAGADTHIGREIYEDGMELSGGETQRLMLARALYKDGAILALDEPTAALDPLAENDIYEKYNEMTAGKTALFISHRLASTRFCDRIVYLEHGRIDEEGTHESLLALGGAYAELFAVQSRYYQEGGTENG